jgi:hypothetical protein
MECESPICSNTTSFGSNGFSVLSAAFSCEKESVGFTQNSKKSAEISNGLNIFEFKIEQLFIQMMFSTLFFGCASYVIGHKFQRPYLRNIYKKNRPQKHTGLPCFLKGKTEQRTYRPIA